MNAEGAARSGRMTWIGCIAILAYAAVVVLLIGLR